MFIRLLQENQQIYFAHILVVIVSICLHELAHGFAAIWLGDRTPEETGHITFNPLVHMGPIALAMLCLTGFTWGMMPVDPTRLRGRHAEALVAAAGPAMNLLLAAIAIIAVGCWSRFGTIDPSNHMVDNAQLLLFNLGVLNLALAALNLVPLPPLDGSRVLASFSRAYRDFAFSPATSGVFLALLVAWLYQGGRFIVPAARAIYYAGVDLVAGHSTYV